jgi:cytochrome c oxidase cbb3-type subunit IV
LGSRVIRSQESGVRSQELEAESAKPEAKYQSIDDVTNKNTVYKEVLTNTANIGVWPVISFVIFFTFFIGLLWWVFWVDKKYVERMANLPLNDEAESLAQNKQKTEKI